MGEDMAKTKVVVVLLSLIVLIMAVMLTLVTWQLYKKESIPDDCKAHGLPINTSTPAVIPPFYDLTEEEIANVRRFLYEQSDLDLVTSDKVFEHTSDSNFIQYLELRVPEKKAVLAFFKQEAEQPTREAVVTIVRGGASDPRIEEYVVGPTSAPSYKQLLGKIPFGYRPYTVLDFLVGLPKIEKYLHDAIGPIIEESYGGRIHDCVSNCLVLRAFTPYSSALSGDPKQRLAWVTLAADVEYFTLHFRDLQFLLDVSTNEFKITSVYYSGNSFGSAEDLARAYEANTINKTRIPFPVNDKALFSSMHRRGKLFPDDPLPPPRTVSPKGQRYSVMGRHVSYMGWEFDLRMSTLSGPQLFDIRYHDNRIVYELSLQEIAVFYSGHSPAHRVADFVDSLGLLGNLGRSLIPGIDCPEDSTFIGSLHSLEYSETPVDIPRAFCVFEHNTNMPLRRHLNSFTFDDQFFEGMMGTALVVRTIITVINYDYIFDFMFYQNGAIQVKPSSTGYIIGSLFSEAESAYGFRLQEHVIGNFHSHMFNFKVDLDINGEENTFERLNMVPTEVDHSEYSSSPGASYSQVKVVRDQIKTEKSAAITSDDEKPCYYTFYNDKHKNKHGVPKAYRLHSKGSFKQLLSKGKGNEPTISWARYALAVTKRKEAERRSSSFYASWDASDPVVNFQGFIDDNENLTNQDLVCWVTLGLHHIPHTEDLPVTPTVGQGLEFYLLPHNYFDEDPAMGSSDSVRIELEDKKDIKKGLKIVEYGKNHKERCYMENRYDYEDIKKNPQILFDNE